MPEQVGLYLYLSSQSRTLAGQRANNTPANFSTYFNSPIDLSEELTYEVALVKLLYPRTAVNGWLPVFEYYSFQLGSLQSVTLPEKQYDSPQELIAAFNSHILPNDLPYYQLSVLPDGIFFELTLRAPNGSHHFPSLRLYENLTALTGLPSYTAGPSHLIGHESWFPTGGLGQAYVYSDVFNANTRLNERFAPLFSILPYYGVAGQACYEPATLNYFPLNKKQISSIQIRIETEGGSEFPFRAGEVTCLLHIKPTEL